MLRPAAINPLFTANSEQFTANRSRDASAAYIKHHESQPLITEVWCETFYRNAQTGHSIWSQDAAPESGFYTHGAFNFGARHRRQHRHLQRDLRCAAAAAPIQGRRSSRCAESTSSS